VIGIALLFWALAGALYAGRRVAFGDRPAAVHVRWAPSVDEGQRTQLERQYGLIAPQEDTPGGFFDLSLIRTDGSATLPFNSLAAWARARVPSGAVVGPGAPLVLPPAPAVKQTTRGRKVKREPKAIAPAAFKYPPRR